MNLSKSCEFDSTMPFSITEGHVTLRVGIGVGVGEVVVGGWGLSRCRSSEFGEEVGRSELEVRPPEASREARKGLGSVRDPPI